MEWWQLLLAMIAAHMIWDLIKMCWWSYRTKGGWWPERSKPSRWHFQK